MRITSILSIIICLLILVTGCQNEDIAYPELSSSTLIVYMGGDNNLSSETSQKIGAIQKYVASSREFTQGEGRVEILIYQDPASSSGEPPKLWRACYGQEKAQVIRTYTNESSASAQVLARVVRECMAISPSKHYGLWIFSHASGWLPKGTLGSPYSKSIITDGQEEMDIKDFAKAIPEHTFDYIVFEACFMAGIEVAYELKDKTDYIIASSAEILSPGMTNIYATMLPNVISGDLIAAAQIYYEHWSQESATNKAATVSVIRTSALEEVATVVRDIKHNNITPTIDGVQHFDRYVEYRLFFDLEDYFSKMATTHQIQQLKQAIERAVLYQASTPTFLLHERGFKIERHCGLTSYIKQNSFPFLNGEYDKLQWNKAIN